MKNKYIIIALMTLLFGVGVSCSDFLNEDARGVLTPDTFFKNEEEAILALNQLNEASVSGTSFNDHLGTDQGVSGRITLAPAHRIGVYEYTSETGQIVSGWSSAYTVIRDANLVIASIERSSLSDQVKGEVIAQTLFFRAITYLKLVTDYGDVPYWRDELNNIEEVSLLGKTDSKEIIKGMAEDLGQAISAGYLFTGRWNQNDGRPTVWAARMLKAYCHAWLAQYDVTEWAAARAELIEVTTNSPHGPALGPYEDMYRAGNELHNEVIFGKQFLADIKGGRTLQVARFNSAAENGPTRTAMAQVGITNGSAPLILRKSFADSYDPTDARKPYNVWQTAQLTSGATATFNWTYITKLLRAPVPASDPLVPVAETGNNSNDTDRIFLLADAYLLLAEAEFMIGGSTTEALEAINTVRTRANLPDLVTLTIEDIQRERSWELVAEGLWGRKKDLIRWGILESTVSGIPAAEIAAGASVTAISRAQDEADIIDNAPLGKFRVFPIPLFEVQKSRDIGGALTQNPLWTDN